MNATGRLLRSRGVILEFLAGHAIPALLPTFHHVALGLYPGEKLFHQRPMAGVGGADEAVMADLPTLPEVVIESTDGIAVGLGRQPGRFSGPLDLEAMLVAAGDEANRLAAEPTVAGDGVAGKRGVGTPQVGLVVDVVQGGRERVSHRWTTEATTGSRSGRWGRGCTETASIRPTPLEAAHHDPRQHGPDLDLTDRPGAEAGSGTRCAPFR